MNSKYENLYKYVNENIGTGKIKFQTKVSEEEFREYIDNYPGEVVSNAFMGYVDYYDFSKQKPDEAHWYYKVARHYVDFGADDYLLPTISQ